MKTPTHLPAAAFRLRSRSTLLCLLAAIVGLGLWHFRKPHGQLSVASDVTTQSHPALAAAVAPESPAPGAARAEGGGVAVAGQPTNVRMASSPEESPAWAVPYGEEFWRTSASSAPAPAAGDTNAPSPFNVGEVVERVSHAFRPGDVYTLPEVKAQTYTARFDESAGLGFSPHRPAVSPEETNHAGAQEPPGRDSRRPARPHPATRPQADPETEAWFRTLSVARGGQAFFTAGQDTPQWSLLGNTAQGLLNETAGLVAHYEARANGVEVSWVLPQAPAGAGPLVIESELSGLSYAGATEHGLHFADAAGVARVRVGPVTVVDAAGGRWDLAMAVDGNHLRLEVPADLLAQATYPLAIDPALEAEFEMDRVIGPSGVEHYFPSVAAGSSGYLVVWSEDSGVYGARVSPTGVVSDPAGLLISTSAFRASVAAGSSGYLVVWADMRNGNSDIYGARVTTGGVVSDPAGLPISTTANGQGFPSVAASSSGYLVVWLENQNVNGTGDIYGARVTTEGVVSDPEGLLISTSTTWGLSVAGGSSGYLVVWTDRRNGNSDIYGARVTPDGVVSETNGFPIATADNDQYSPSVAGGSSGYLVVWTDAPNGKNADIFGARVTPAGVVSDSAGLLISASATGDRPSVAAGSSGYLVVWTDYRNGNFDIYGARVTTAGVVSDPAGLLICTAENDQYFPSVAAGSSGYLVVWQDTRNGNSDIYGARVTTGGEVSDPAGLPISTADNYQSLPSVAGGSNGYLVVWTDYRNDNNYDIYGARVTTEGVVSDPAGLPICTEASHQVWPSVAAGSSSYLVVWEDYRNGNADIYGARVTPDGVVSETNGFSIATAPGHQQQASVTAASDGYVIMWWDEDKNTLFWHRLNAAGQLLESNPLAINGSAGRSEAVAAYGSAGRFLLTSTAYRKGAKRIIGSLHSTDRPAAGPVVAFKAAGFSVLENKGEAIIAVILSGNSPGTITVDYEAADGTAQAGADYSADYSRELYGTLVFPTGTKQQTFTIRIAADTLQEASETVNLTLSNPGGGATLGLHHRAVLTILNDDLAGIVSLSAAAYSVRESTPPSRSPSSAPAAKPAA